MARFGTRYAWARIGGYRPLPTLPIQDDVLVVLRMTAENGGRDPITRNPVLAISTEIVDRLAHYESDGSLL